MLVSIFPEDIKKYGKFWINVMVFTDISKNDFGGHA